MTGHAALVVVSYQCLEQLIGLPTGQRITAVVPACAHDVQTATLRLFIEGADLPRVQEGEIPQELTCRVTRNSQGCPEAHVE